MKLRCGKSDGMCEKETHTHKQKERSGKNVKNQAVHSKSATIAFRKGNSYVSNFANKRKIKKLQKPEDIHI